MQADDTYGLRSEELKLCCTEESSYSTEYPNYWYACLYILLLYYIVSKLNLISSYDRGHCNSVLLCGKCACAACMYVECQLQHIYVCREHGLTTKAVKKALHRTFKAMDAEIIAAEETAGNPDAEHAGTTASIALQLGTQLYVADVGEHAIL